MRDEILVGDLGRKIARKRNADTIRYALAPAIEKHLRSWPEMHISYQEGPIGTLVVKDAAGEMYRVRLTVDPIDG